MAGIAAAHGGNVAKAAESDPKKIGETQMAGIGLERLRQALDLSRFPCPPVLSREGGNSSLSHAAWERSFAGERRSGTAPRRISRSSGSDIVKGYESSKGKYVVVEDEELKKICSGDASTMEIVCSLWCGRRTWMPIYS